MNINKLDDMTYYLATDKQKMYIDTVRKHGTNSAAAKALGVNESSVRSAIKLAFRRAEKRHVNGLPEMHVGETKKLGKITTHIKDGVVKNIWYRQDEDHEALENALQCLVEDLTPSAPVVKTPKHTNSDLLTSYNIGDMHIAMHSWHEETGNDFDVNIATGDLTNAMSDLIGRSLPSETCIILNLGDAIHFHDDSHSTKLSKNPLDADTRVDKAFRITCVLMNKFVEMAMQKHKKVVVRNVLGNHDMELAMALRYQMDAYWRNEKRVSVEMSPADTWFFEFGKVMLMATHGHNMKPDKMIPYMSARMPEMWGRCLLRRAVHGHFHSKSIIEGLGGKVEGFSNLAPNDAWHESKGYRSELECVAIIYHKCGKEVGRQNYMLHHDEVGNSDNAGMLGKY